MSWVRKKIRKIGMQRILQDIIDELDDIIDKENISDKNAFLCDTYILRNGLNKVLETYIGRYND